MNKDEMLDIVKALPFDKKHIVYKKSDFSVFLLRPSGLSARFKAYDRTKNFQIWLKEGEREFRPTSASFHRFES
jgi:hypothetical protein